MSNGRERKLKDKASVFYREGKLKDALKLYERIVAEDPTELQCQIKIGDIYRKLGNRDAAVGAYEPVARAYADDGLLLKSIAVCKMILTVDPRHTETQEMLADLYSKRRAPPRSIPAAMTPPPGPPPIELPAMDDEAPVISRTSMPDGPKIVTGTPETPGTGDVLLQGNAPPASSWPPAQAVTPEASGDGPPTIPWPQSAGADQTSEPEPPPPAPSPVAPHLTPRPQINWPGGVTPTPEKIESNLEPGGSIEDSVLDITVGEMMTESQANAPASLEQNTDEEIHTLLDQMADEPLDTPEEPIVELTQKKKPEPGSLEDLESAPPPPRRFNIPQEETWSGVIKLEDVDRPEAVAATSELDDAPSDVRHAPPIELTQRANPEASNEDIGSALERPHIPLFSDLPKSAFIELLVQMEMKEMYPGEYVIKEGDVDDSFFVIATGRVRVSRKDDNGEDVVLAYLEDGAFFGEMALLQDGARTASVIVEEESQIFEINKQVLDNVVTQYPSVAGVLKNFYRQRLLSTAMATNMVFRPFGPDQRRDLMEMFKSKNFDKGTDVLTQGKKGSGLFLLLYGKLEVIREKEDGEVVTLAQLGPGDMFGEMSLLTNQPTNATVRCVTDCFVVRLSKRKFDTVIMTHPQILELVAQVSEQRQSTNDMLLGDLTPSGAILV